MSGSVIAAALWVLAGTATAMLSMRRQYVPGLALLLAAPVLIGWLWHDFGWVVGVIGTLAFLSMFRRPLLFLIAKARGQNPEIPR